MNRIGSLNISSRTFVALSKAMNLSTVSFNCRGPDHARLVIARATFEPLICGKRPPRGNDSMTLKRCGWSGQDPLLIVYHDEEWGVPVHEDNRLFEMLVLESMQSGLSWMTILRNAKHFKSPSVNLRQQKWPSLMLKELEKLLVNADIVRNRAKLEAAVANARATLQVQEKYGSLAAFLWRRGGRQTFGSSLGGLS